MMIKKVGIVSLSSGIIGESFVRHENEIGVKRLEEMGLEVEFLPHALCGLDYIKAHPEKRAEDLLRAFNDDSIDMILCAIGGDDTYSLLPYLFANDELKKAVKQKVFLGFSDTTANHFMLNKVGLNTFYGQSFLADICELDSDMLPYSERYFRELITTGTISSITPSDNWYEERTDFSEAAVGTPRVSHINSGFDLVQGRSVFSGSILGGCIETIYDFFSGDRYSDSPLLCSEYSLFPAASEWKDNILLLETSEEKTEPDNYRKMLETLESTGVFEAVNGVICGKPMYEKYYNEYRDIIRDVISDPDLPVVFNINIGHATPRCIIPFGVEAEVDAINQVIRFK